MKLFEGDEDEPNQELNIKALSRCWLKKSVGSWGGAGALKYRTAERRERLPGKITGREERKGVNHTGEPGKKRPEQGNPEAGEKDRAEKKTTRGEFFCSIKKKYICSCERAKANGCHGKRTYYGAFPLKLSIKGEFGKKQYHQKNLKYPFDL